MKQFFYWLALVSLAVAVSAAGLFAVGRLSTHEPLFPDRSPTRDFSANFPTVCPVHHVAMPVVQIPFEYGLLIADPSEPSVGVRESEFPYALSYVPGGCSIEPGQPQALIIRQCPECMRAEAAWRAAHPPPTPTPGA